MVCKNEITAFRELFGTFEKLCILSSEISHKCVQNQIHPNEISFYLFPLGTEDEEGQEGTKTKQI